ncbi:hypothetical protein DFH29DRAFT_157761 [Suillus ampliporus]|nr:hypothetical protein DFH29DRAFT_157761 [Suillus ampliporus]
MLGHHGSRGPMLHTCVRRYHREPIHTGAPCIEKGSDEDRLDTFRMLTINGNPQPTPLMPVIQYIMNKQLKKLHHFYWEVYPKYDENGKLKQEMILVVYVFLLFSSGAYTYLPQQRHPK